MKKLLIFGNSFSIDGTRYLHEISRAGGEVIHVWNLEIGGCSLYRHYRNMLSGEPAYELYFNGHNTKVKISAQQMLLSEEWDYISLQESSRKAGDYENFQPYLDELTAYVRRCAPKAKLIYHMSWTYPEGSRIFAQTPFAGPQEMYPNVVQCAERAAKDMDASLIVPSGKAMWKLCSEIGEEAYRDSFHCDLGQSRYMLGALWFMALTGKTIEGNTFRDFDVEVTEEQVLRAQRIAAQTAREAGFIK